MADWIDGLINSAGVFGIALLMFLENLFPPIPSELIMPLAGYSAAEGTIGLAPVILAGSVGSLCGTTVWFVVARWFGEVRLRRWAERFGRVLTLTSGDIDHGDRWFDRNGHFAVLFARMLPAVRTIISIPAGLAGMGWGRFLLYSSIGTLAWTAFLAGLGYGLGSRATSIHDWVDPISTAVLAAAVLLYLWRFATYPRRKARERANANAFYANGRG